MGPIRSDHNNRLKTLSVITISGFHYTTLYFTVANCAQHVLSFPLIIMSSSAPNMYEVKKTERQLET